MLTMFLVSSVPARDEAAFWQLQLLGPAYGFNIKMAHRSGVTELGAEAHAAIRDSDVVVAIVTKRLSAWAAAELDAALKLRRPTLAVVAEGLGARSGVPANIEVVEFAPGSDIGQVATAIMEHLRVVFGQSATARKGHRPPPPPVNNNTLVAAGWIVGVGVGLLALAALSKAK